MNLMSHFYLNKSLKRNHNCWDVNKSLSILCCLFFLSSCGYAPLHRRTTSASPINITVVENQTSYKNVSPVLKSALRSEMQLLGVPLSRISEGNDSVSRLEVRVFSISVETLALKIDYKMERPVNRRWTVDAVVTLYSAGKGRKYGPKVISVDDVGGVWGDISTETAIAGQVREQLLNQLARQIAFWVQDFHTNM